MRGILLGAILLAIPALAGAEEKNVKWAKETVIDFEDDTITGDLTRPDGEFVDARGQVQHTNLIKVRENFREEVLESVGEL